MFSEISFEEWHLSPHQLFTKQRLLLTAYGDEGRNTMTVGWGGFGVMWGEPVALFAVRPSRYTYHLLGKSASVSLSALPQQYARAVALCGARSGREGDKMKEAGLTYVGLPCGGVGVGEAELVIVGRVLCAHPLSPAELDGAVLLEKWYRDGDFHTLYYATISKIYKSC